MRWRCSRSGSGISEPPNLRFREDEGESSRGAFQTSESSSQGIFKKWCQEVVSALSVFLMPHWLISTDVKAGKRCRVHLLETKTPKQPILFNFHTSISPISIIPLSLQRGIEPHVTVICPAPDAVVASPQMAAKARNMLSTVPTGHKDDIC